MLIRRPQQRVVLPATLLVTMMAGAFQLMFFAVLAAPLLDDMGMSRAELGILGSINTLAGAVTAPLTGRVVDRIGPAHSVVGSLVLASAGMAGLALSPSLAWLSVAAVIGGIPLGSSNPATNSLISARVDPGRRGTLTGIKQSGVTMAGFIAGITLPGLDAALGWRGACWFYAAVFAAAALFAQTLLTSDGQHAAESQRPPVPRSTGPIPSVAWWIAAYAFFMGLASGAIGRFLPLFAEESLGFSTGTAGLIAALAGLFGMAARIVAARIAEHRIAPTRLLIVLSCVGAAFGAVLAATTMSTRMLIWLAPPLNAIGTNAWNAVAMLAIIMFVTQSQAGRASGVVMLGFLGGMATAAPLTGWVVDTTGDYRLAWVGTIVTSLVAASIMIVTDRKRVRTAS